MDYAPLHRRRRRRVAKYAIRTGDSGHWAVTVVNRSEVAGGHVVGDLHVDVAHVDHDLSGALLPWPPLRLRATEMFAAPADEDGGAILLKLAGREPGHWYVLLACRRRGAPTLYCLRAPVVSFRLAQPGGDYSRAYALDEAGDAYLFDEYVILRHAADDPYADYEKRAIVIPDSTHEDEYPQFWVGGLRLPLRYDPTRHEYGVLSIHGDLRVMESAVSPRAPLTQEGYREIMALYETARGIERLGLWFLRWTPGGHEWVAAVGLGAESI
jgi:hypothetical protein